MRLIDADALKKRAIRMSTVKERCYFKAVGTQEIDRAPTIAAVPRYLYDQVKKERDAAINRLEKHGIKFDGA
jgi:hypothetical protein